VRSDVKFSMVSAFDWSNPYCLLLMMLRTCDDQGRLTFRQAYIAKTFRVSVGAVSRRVHRYVEAGYVRCLPHPDDHRVNLYIINRDALAPLSNTLYQDFEHKDAIVVRRQVPPKPGTHSHGRRGTVPRRSRRVVVDEADYEQDPENDPWRLPVDEDGQPPRVDADLASDSKVWSKRVRRVARAEGTSTCYGASSGADACPQRKHLPHNTFNPPDINTTWAPEHEEDTESPGVTDTVSEAPPPGFMSLVATEEPSSPGGGLRFPKPGSGRRQKSSPRAFGGEEPPSSSERPPAEPPSGPMGKIVAKQMEVVPDFRYDGSRCPRFRKALSEWLGDGGTLDDVLAMMDEVVTRRADSGEGPPRWLNYYEGPLKEMIEAKRNGVRREAQSKARRRRGKPYARLHAYEYTAEELAERDRLYIQNRVDDSPPITPEEEARWAAEDEERLRAAPPPLVVPNKRPPKPSGLDLMYQRVLAGGNHEKTAQDPVEALAVCEHVETPEQGTDTQEQTQEPEDDGVDAELVAELARDCGPTAVAEYLRRKKAFGRRRGDRDAGAS